MVPLLVSLFLVSSAARNTSCSPIGDVIDVAHAYACRPEYMYAFATQTFTQGYRYRPEDCELWAHISIGDRVKENSKSAFWRLMTLRLQDLPGVDDTWSMLYVGANQRGRDGLHFFEKYGLNVHFFEPSNLFFRNLVESVGSHPNFFFHNYALGAKTEWRQLLMDDESSRVVPSNTYSENAESVLIRSVGEALNEIFPDGIPDQTTFLHINCEGCEFDVVKLMPLDKLQYVQIATHIESVTDTLSDNFEYSRRRYCAMHRKLFETHRFMVGSPWVWERWERRRWEYRGCFVDLAAQHQPRTIPKIDPSKANGILDEPDTEREDPLDTCSRAAAYVGLRYFALQNGGWCGGFNDEEQYWQLQYIDGCSDGRGGYFRNDVYEFVN